MFRSVLAMAFVVLLGVSPAGGKPVAADLQCATPCVDTSEIQGTINADKLDPDVMVSGEGVSALINDADYVTTGRGTVVVDATDQLLGHVVGTHRGGRRLTISFMFDNQLVLLDVNDREVFGTHPLLFEAADCSGPPLISPDPVRDGNALSIKPVVGVGGPQTGVKGNIVSVPDPDAEPFTPPDNDTGALYKFFGEGISRTISNVRRGCCTFIPLPGGAGAQTFYAWLADGNVADPPDNDTGARYKFFTDGNSITGVTDREPEGGGQQDIPLVNGNSDTRDFFAWLADGNVADPAFGPLYAGDGERCSDGGLQTVVSTLEIANMDTLFVAPYRVTPDN